MFSPLSCVFVFIFCSAPRSMVLVFFDCIGCFLVVRGAFFMLGSRHHLETLSCIFLVLVDKLFPNVKRNYSGFACFPLKC